MSLKQEFELLRRVPMFTEIEPAKLKLLAFMSERVAFDPGKQLMRQGDPTDAAYLIIDGQADVFSPGRHAARVPLIPGRVPGAVEIESQDRQTGGRQVLGHVAQGPVGTNEIVAHRIAQHNAQGT